MERSTLTSTWTLLEMLSKEVNPNKDGMLDEAERKAPAGQYLFALIA